jgi:hypothetical protein
MQQDPDLIDFYLEELIEASKVSSFLSLNLDKADRVQQQLQADKQVLISHIEEIFGQLSTAVEDLKQDFSSKLSQISQYKKNLNEEGRCLMDKYRVNGMKGIVNNMLESADLPMERIIRYISEKVDACYGTITNQLESPRVTAEEDASFNQSIRDLLEKDCMIHTLELEVSERDMEISSLKKQMGDLFKKIDEVDSESKSPLNQIRYYTPDTTRYPPNLPKPQKVEDNKLESNIDQDLITIIESSGSRYIYIPNSSSKNLMQYDIHENRVNIIEIPTLEREFDTTSSCELPNGDVFMTGLKNSVIGEAYLYKPGSDKCFPIVPIRHPRCLVDLYYYKHYIYAFGGHCSHKAERYSLYTNSCTRN